MGIRRVVLLIGSVLVTAAATAAPGQTPSQPVVHGGAPSVSPDGSKVAFLSDRDGYEDIYVIAADGTGEKRVTHSPEREGQPEWSSDGGELWFAVFDDPASRIFSVGLQVADGNPVPRGTVPGRVLRVSPKMRRVLYWTGGWTAMKMFVSNLDGSEARQLTDGSGVVWGARWSPDGKEIAFADRSGKDELHIYAIHGDGSGRRQLTRFESSNLREQMPSWSPDGSRLAVQAGASNESTHIWIVDVASGAGRRLAAHTDAFHDEVPAWFRDGKHIAFQSDRTGRMEIWVMTVDGTEPRQLTK